MVIYSYAFNIYIHSHKWSNSYTLIPHTGVSILGDKNGNKEAFKYIRKMMIDAIDKNSNCENIGLNMQITKINGSKITFTSKKRTLKIKNINRWKKY